MKKLMLAVVVACGAIGFARTENLTIPVGETYDLLATATYEQVIVHGTLNIPSGLQLTATNVALGPDEGDVAVINVLGTVADSLKVTGKVSIGENGGTGKIVALGKAKSTIVVSLVTLTIGAAAAVTPDSAYIDILELGGSICDLKSFINESATTARVIVDDGSLGSTAYWGTYRFVGGFRIEGRTATSSISFNGKYTQYRMNDGALTVANCGDVYFTGSADASGGSSDSQYKEMHAGLSWENTGDLVMASRHRMCAAADDVLPYGETCGIVKATESYTWLDVRNHIEHVNGIRASAPVRGSEGGKIIFGEGDTDGVLAASVASVVKVEKVGSGTLTVDGDSSVGTLKVSQGTLKVTSPLAVESIEVSEDAVLELDGQILNPGTADIRGQLVLKNGGRLLTTLDAETGIRDGGRCCPDVVEKTGSGTYVLEDPVLMASNVHVKAGKLMFSAAGYACDLLRLNVTEVDTKSYWIETAAGAGAGRLQLMELAFVDADGNRVGKGITSSDIGTAPSALEPGYAAVPSGYEYANAGASAKGSVKCLFDGAQTPRFGIVSPLVTDDGGVTVYMRLPSDSNPIEAMNYAACWGGFMKSWTLSGSWDGGLTWKTLNATTGYTGYKLNDGKSGTWQGNSTQNIGNPIPKAFPLNNADEALVRPGVKNMPDAMSVQVDSGAVLDFSNVTGGQTINALTIDMEDGAGAISNCVFAAAGTVDIRNLAPGVKLGGLSIPLELGNAAAVSNLKSWTIVVNGEAVRPGRYVPVYKDGYLTFAPCGLLLIVR